MRCESEGCNHDAARQLSIRKPGAEHDERRSYCRDCFASEMREAMEKHYAASGDGIATVLPFSRPDDLERLLRESILIGRYGRHEDCGLGGVA